MFEATCPSSVDSEVFHHRIVCETNLQHVGDNLYLGRLGNEEVLVSLVEGVLSVNSYDAILSASLLEDLKVD